MKTNMIMLLAGHSFDKKGCSAKIEGEWINEWDLTTWLVSEVFKRERNKKCDLIIKARNDFKDLVSEVNRINPDILISCHFNALNGNVQGTEVLCAEHSKKGRELATLTQKILVKHLKLKDRGIKPTPANGRGGSILNKTKPVAILIEPFFLDNVKTKKELNDYMEKTIQSLLDLIDSIC